jgi:4-aminobutyrate aminotransferase-like enzyme
VEIALKTARLATGKRGVIAFEGGYHGLGYGALNATFRDHFRHPFENQLGAFGSFVPFPKASGPSDSELDQTEARIRDRFQVGDVGAILVEPVQARGGIHIPPPGFLPLLRRLCDEYQALLILDEIYTGFGRTGRWFACEHSGVVPDLICLGKALTGGFPLSACVGRAEVMDAWPPSNGEAIHTSTFLGHPVGCAMALAQISEIESQQLISKSETVGQKFLQILSQLEGIYGSCKLTARGIGLMAGVELTYADGSPATRESLLLIKNLLGLGYVLLPEAAAANVISFTPPLTISLLQLRSCVRQLQQQLIQVAGSRIPHPKPSRRRSRSLP